MKQVHILLGLAMSGVILAGGYVALPSTPEKTLAERQQEMYEKIAIAEKSAKLIFAKNGDAAAQYWLANHYRDEGVSIIWRKLNAGSNSPLNKVMQQRKLTWGGHTVTEKG